MKSKPQYYNDYFIEENDNNLLMMYQKYNYTSITLLTIFMFCGSITDLIYSYMTLDTCQNITYFITLDNWFQINGIFGIIFYFFIIITLYYISNSHHQGYTRLINQSTKTTTERQEIFYKVFLTVNAIIMLLFFSVGMYLFFFHFGHYCTSYAITVYLWVRLLSGTITSIVLLFFINC